MKTTSVKELFSRGSFERSADLDIAAGLARNADFEGEFRVTVLNASVPDQSAETPDPHVVLSGCLRGQTDVDGDTNPEVEREVRQLRLRRS